MAEINDEELMRELLKGNKAAFELLYDRYFDKLVWYAGGFLQDIQKAEDVVQEVFVKIIEEPGFFDVSRKFSTWVYHLTANACKNQLRTEKNRSRIGKHYASEQKNTVTYPVQSDVKYLENRVQQALSTMSEKEKNIYSLRFEQEMSIKEIAVLSNIPEGSVKSGIYYLLKKFSIQLKEFADGK